jgi:uncharacterized protein (TIGR00297 family)
MPLISAVGIACAVALAGAVLGALTLGGALLASLVGAAILWTLGSPGLAALGAFFLGASANSRLAPDPGHARLDTKGPRRDPLQVLANGGTAALGALLELIQPGAGLWVATSSLAAAAADTWATALGGWSPTPPRHLVTGERVLPGTGGGVTWYGTAGALVGAFMVGAAVVLTGAPVLLFPLALGVGMLGMLADSLLGALWQGRFHCQGCDQPTERALHRCGSAATLVAGHRWLTNDGVNAIATFLAGALGYLVWSLTR